MQVRWNEIGENRYTPLVEALLNLRFPDAEVIDGSGGDGGRDVQRRLDGTLVIYQLKYFPGRIDSKSGRRNQIIRSLRKVSALNPDEWYLVVPTQLTPKELEWFDGLRKHFPFIAGWRGERWLDGHLSREPGLVRYFLHDVHGEVLGILREFNADQAVLAGGVPDLQRRLDALASRANDISPNYRVAFQIHPDGTHIELTKKRPQAPPVVFTPEFQPGGDLEGMCNLVEALSEVIDYGGQITLGAPHLKSLKVDAPAELGRRGTFTPDTVEFRSLEDQTGLPLPGVIAVYDGSERPISQVQVIFDRRIGGERGVTLLGQIPGRFLEVRLKLDADGRRFRLNMNDTDQIFSATPAALAPIMRFATAATAGRRLELKAGPFSGQVQLEVDIFPNLAPWAEVIENLAVLQQRLGLCFTVPDPLTRSEADLIEKALKLLDGHQVPISRGPLRLGIRENRITHFLDALTAEGNLIIGVENIQLDIGDQQIGFGPGYYNAHVRLANRAELERLAREAPRSEAEAVFELAAATPHLTVQLGEPPTSGTSRQALAS